MVADMQLPLGGLAVLCIQDVAAAIIYCPAASGGYEGCCGVSYLLRS